MNEADIAQAVWAKASPYLAYIGAARLVMKPVGLWIQSAIARAIAKAVETPELGDDQLVERVMTSKWYRGFAFGLDLGLSIKLPTAAKLKGGQ